MATADMGRRIGWQKDDRLGGRSRGRINRRQKKGPRRSGLVIPGGLLWPVFVRGSLRWDPDPPNDACKSGMGERPASRTRRTAAKWDVEGSTTGHRALDPEISLGRSFAYARERPVPPRSPNCPSPAPAASVQATESDTGPVSGQSPALALVRWLNKRLHQVHARRPPDFSCGNLFSLSLRHPDSVPRRPSDSSAPFPVSWKVGSGALPGLGDEGIAVPRGILLSLPAGDVPFGAIPSPSSKCDR